MADVFKTKLGNTAKALRILILPATRILTGASVQFRMRERYTGTSKVNAAAVIVTATGTPTVEYSFTAGDLDTLGEFEADFTVTYSNGKSETFPESGHILVLVGEQAV